jgi:putative FmdB family regulatory protein
MPLYEYQCDACAHRFEVIQKYSDAPVEICPKCGGVVKKLLSSPAIQFKGTGWYITDYAKSGKSDSGTAAAAKSESAEKSGAKSEGSSESKSDSKSESKSESKPETKTESKSESKSKSETKSETKSSE